MNPAARPWLSSRHALSTAFVVAGLVAVVGGCSENRTEDCFVQPGTLSQVTSDTTATDHIEAALSPDGTRVLFVSDFWVELFPLDKDQGQGDFALIDVPGPGEHRTPVPSVTDEGNGRRVVIEDLVPDAGGTPFRAISRQKGGVSWTADGLGFVAVIGNDESRDRLYRLSFGADDPETREIQAHFEQLIDDVGLATAGDTEKQYYYATPAVSPDGEWVAYSRYYYRETQTATFVQIPAIFAFNFATQQVVRVTNGSTFEQDPAWSPDGQWIAFTTNGGPVGLNEIYKVRFDPNNPAQERQKDEAFTDGRVRLTYTGGSLKLPEQSFDPFWARNGRIIFTSTRRPPCTSRRIRNIWSMDGGGGDVRVIAQTAFDDYWPCGANYDGQSSDADNTLIFSSQRNPVEDFQGQKLDLWAIRGGGF